MTPTRRAAPHCSRPTSIENLAQEVLEKYASDQAHPEASLGSYVVGLLLREAENNGAQDNNNNNQPCFLTLEEVDPELRDSLLELLQDHCLVDQKTALQALQEVYQVVQTSKTKAYKLQVSTSMLQSPMMADALSPRLANALIPNDLLGEAADTSLCVQPSSAPPGFSAAATTTTDTVLQASFRSVDDVEFPALGASGPTIPKTRARKSSFAGSSSSACANDTMMADGRGIRSRESSLDETTTTSHSTSSTTAFPQQPHYHAASNATSYPYLSEQQEEENYHHQYQESYYDGNNSNTLDSCVDYLLAMNEHLPLSRPAAVSAAMTADYNPAMAQYLIDLALAAPPVCRHYLDKGCYRADCTYNHDVGVCLFWIKGSCRSRADDCVFRHEFDRQIVQDVMAKLEQEAYTESGAEEGYYGAADEATQEAATTDSLQQEDSSKNCWGQPQSSFAAIASQGYSGKAFADSSEPWSQRSGGQRQNNFLQIPQDLWNPHENRDSSVFFIDDPMERYAQASKFVRRSDVIDLHFQSIKTFPIVLANTLPAKLETMSTVWIVTGTGHHVGSQTHQKGGGALENAVVDWLTRQGYDFSRGRDRNGQGGAILVRQ